MLKAGNPLSEEFHKESKKKSSSTGVDLDRSQWPQEWLTTYFKHYDRFPRFSLPDPVKEIATEKNLFLVLENRKTNRSFSGKGVSSEELSTWLKYACGETSSLDEARMRRTYPSGGARYSVEHYVLLLKESGDLKKGIYHYRVDSHELELVTEDSFLKIELENITEAEWVRGAAFVHIMTSVFWRSQNKYKERGYRLLLLEAGHVGQNAYLVSGALGMGCCALSGVFEDVLEKAIGLDEKTESIVHTVVVGTL